MKTENVRFWIVKGYGKWGEPAAIRQDFSAMTVLGKNYRQQQKNTAADPSEINIHGTSVGQLPQLIDNAPAVGGVGVLAPLRIWTPVRRRYGTLRWLRLLAHQTRTPYVSRPLTHRRPRIDPFGLTAPQRASHQWTTAGLMALPGLRAAQGDARPGARDGRTAAGTGSAGGPVSDRRSRAPVW